MRYELLATGELPMAKRAFKMDRKYIDINNSYVAGLFRASSRSTLWYKKILVLCYSVLC